ncbi:MAG: hypothetical protein ACLGHY_09385, partial [Gammaproteobacteria bacterium]
MGISNTRRQVIGAAMAAGGLALAGNLPARAQSQGQGQAQGQGAAPAKPQGQAQGQPPGQSGDIVIGGSIPMSGVFAFAG